MAEQVVGLKINVDGSDAAKSVGTLKSQLKEAQAAVGELSEKFGATSAAAVEAAKKAAKLKDAIGDAKALTDAFSPDEKFKAFGAAIQGVVGGFTALQGAQALFGVQSEDVAKTLAKVQGALALSQGIDSVLAAKDSFVQLGAKLKDINIIQSVYNLGTKAATYITTAFGVAVDATSTSFKVLRATLISTGIGALVVLIGYAVGKIMEWNDATDKQKLSEENLKKEEKLLEEQIKNTNAEIDKRNNLQKYQQTVEVANAKAKGASLKELRSIEDKYNQESIAAALKAFERQITATENIKTQYDEQSDVYKTAFAQQEKLADDYHKLNQNSNIVEANRRLEDYTNLQKLAADKKTLEDSNRAKKEAADKEAADKEKERLANIAAQNKHTDELITQNRLANIKDEFFKKQAELDIQRQTEIDAEIDLYNKKLISKEQYEINKAEIDGRYAAQQITLVADNEAKNAAAKKDAADKATAAAEKTKEDNIRIAEEERNAKVQFAQDIGNALSILGDLIGKQTAAGKALGIAQALINTWIGVSEVLRAKSVLPEPLATVSKVVNVAAIVATGIKAVKNITAVKVPGGGGGGGNTPSNLGVTAPVGMAPSNTLLNQQLINQQGNAAVRSFVLESDVSGNQERIRRLNRAARIN